jgi:putative ABC transport system permease protein
VTRSPTESTDALFTEVAPGYFAAMGTRIVRGRALDDRDRPEALRTAVVNEAMARKYWPGQDPIGRRFRMDDPNGTAFTIVGVAETGKYITLGEEPTPYFFLPLWQNYASRVRILLRTRLDPQVVAAGLHSELRSIDPSLPLFGIKTMEQFLERSLWGTGAAAGALGSLGLFVLVLAAVGIHGIVSWSVAQRTHEIGIRMALGASARSVRRSVVSQGLVLAVVGILLGSAGALALARVLANLLFGVTPADPVTFLAMALLLTSVALAAAYLPARRAALLDPARALRHE